MSASSTAASCSSRWSDMAGFHVSGLDRLDIDLAQLAAVEDADALLILERGGEVIKAAHQRYLNAFHHLTGQLEASISIVQKAAGEKSSVIIGQKGKRRGAFTGKRMKKDRNGRRRSSGHYEGSNREVAYFLEYGTPRMPATHWMETANEQAMEEAQAAMETAWDEYLKSKGF